MTDHGALTSTDERFALVIKTADETVNNSTFQDDDALTFSVAASTDYVFRITIFFDTVAAADFKCQLTGPASPTLLRVAREAIRPGETAYAEIGVWTAFSTALSLLGTGTTGGVVLLRGILHNGSNAGSVTLQWAQATTDAGNTTVLKGSYLEWAQV